MQGCISERSRTTTGEVKRKNLVLVSMISLKMMTRRRRHRTSKKEVSQEIITLQRHPSRLKNSQVIIVIREEEEKGSLIPPRIKTIFSYYVVTPRDPWRLYLHLRLASQLRILHSSKLGLQLSKLRLVPASKIYNQQPLH